ncbi:MAG: slipin family protein [Candidatus Izemoplasmatales bacterium]|nr:slipin family protein [Candidatus Izemoplasmatales bacterium]
MFWEYVIIIVAILAFLSILGFRVNQEYERSLLFVLGRYITIKGPGLYWIIPFISRIVRVDTRTRTVDIDTQETVTKDSVTIRVNAVLYYRITNPKDAILEVERYQVAIFQAALTVLRNVIGQNNLDDVLKNRDQINQSLREIVDTITDPWGLKVELVEMKDVEIPQSMQRAMAKEAEATREKRARVIKAEGELDASKKLAQAAEEIAKTPYSLELRRMQMITEVGAEQNTTTIMLMPSDFVTLAKNLNDQFAAKKKDS